MPATLSTVARSRSTTGHGDRVAGGLLELVDVERERRTGPRGRDEVGEQCVVVELEVGRRDHRDVLRHLPRRHRRQALRCPRSSARRSAPARAAAPSTPSRWPFCAQRATREFPRRSCRGARHPRSRHRSGSRGTARRPSTSSSRPPSRSGVSAAAIVLAIAAMLVPGAARASGLLDVNAQHVTPRGARERERSSSTPANGRARHVLRLGRDQRALSRVAGFPQVRFEHDYSGGLKLEHRSVWKTFRNECRPYDGPPLAYLVAACTAPDGSYWALQSWQRNLPHRGCAPWTHLAERLGASRLPLEWTGGRTSSSTPTGPSVGRHTTSSAA